jgi:hypothetical protein
MRTVVVRPGRRGRSARRSRARFPAGRSPEVATPKISRRIRCWTGA